VDLVCPAAPLVAVALDALVALGVVLVALAAWVAVAPVVASVLARSVPAVVLVRDLGPAASPVCWAAWGPLKVLGVVLVGLVPVAGPLPVVVVLLAPPVWVAWVAAPRDKGMRTGSTAPPLISSTRTTGTRSWATCR
jgi:hypothetical protein